MAVVSASRTRESAPGSGFLAAQVLGEPALAGPARASGATTRYPETRIGLFGVSGETATEPFGFVSASSHRASVEACGKVTADLFFFVAQDPIPARLLAEIAMPASSFGTYTYVEGDPIQKRDPSGMKACGPLPPTTPNCAADCAAVYQWQLCNLHNLDFAYYVVVLLVGGGGAYIGGGVGGGYGACGGFIVGAGGTVLVHKFVYTPLFEGNFENDYKDCLRKCAVKKCADAGGPCHLVP